MAGLVARSDFPEAMQHVPMFTRDVIRKVGELEYEYYQAKEGTKVCVQCRERQRLAMEKLRFEPRRLPMPPLP